MATNIRTNGAESVIVTARSPRPRSTIVSNPNEDEHTDGDDTDQDGRVRDPAEEEYSRRTKSEDDKSEKRGQDPRVSKIPRPAYDEAVSNNDAWVGSTSINDAELPISFVISQCFGFFPSHLSPQERVNGNHGYRVSTSWYEPQSYTSGTGLPGLLLADDGSDESGFSRGV